MFDRVRHAGVTTMQLLPGSGSLFGGRSVVLKNVPSVTVQGMKFPGAPYGLKIACGENVIGGSKGIRTRAGAMQGYRNAFIAAQDYEKRMDAAAKKPGGEPPKRDLMLETLAGVLKGEIAVHIHCYRADEMAQMLDLSHEFGFHIAAFHHATEAFKIAPLLAREHVAVVTWAGDWSGYKLEAYDSIMENAAVVERAGGLVTLHSDNPELMQHLNQEAGRAMTAGQEAGLGTTPEQAIRWVTLNPAKILGIADRTGSLEPGKMADVVLWSAYPFSVYAAPDLVLIDGAVVVDAEHLEAEPASDFELGQSRRRTPRLSPPPAHAEPHP
jgi:imidazolonepropionase-like amidohydrolase